MYPAGETGGATVVLRVIVGKDGGVEGATPISGAPAFIDAAVAAVKRWRFRPARRDGVAMAAAIRVQIVFTPPAAAPVAPPPPPPARHAPPPASTPRPPPSSTAAPRQAAEPITDVSVHATRVELGTTHIPREEARFVPGAFGDPFHVIDVLPGVAPVVSGLPYYLVRGAASGDVGYFIDGVQVPLLFHVGAGPSIIAPALVDDVELFAGGYPTAYDGHAGGVVVGTTRAPARKLHGEAEARVFDARAFVESPFDHGRGAASVSGRYAYTRALLSLVAPNYGLDYWDYQARVSHVVGDHGRLTLFALGASDEVDTGPEHTAFFRSEFHRVDLRYDHRTERGAARVAATFGYDDILSAKQDLSRPARRRFFSGRLRARVSERLTRGRGLTLRAGADASYAPYSQDEATVPGGSVALGPHDDYHAGAYVDLVVRRGRVELVPGVRYDYEHVRGANAAFPGPRLALRVRIAPRVTWITALGTAHQTATAAVLMPGRATNVLEGSEQVAYQYSTAVQAGLPAGLSAKVTGFYATRVATSTVATTPAALASERSYGLEVFLRRALTRKLGGMLSYTLSRTEHPSDGSLGPFDSTHVLTAVLTYDLGRSWHVGARFFLRTGYPYQVACPTSACAPGGDPAQAHTLVEVRGPWFYRLDVRMEKRWTFPTWWIGGSIEWFNATLSSEVTGASYSPDAGITMDTMSPLTLPSLGVEGGF